MTKKISLISELRQTLREHKRLSDIQVGLVPTMGYLHEGHASLIRKAREACDVVVVSIFVNPLQFGPNEDFDKYPRDEERDLALASQEGADYVFMPDVQEMYPVPMKSVVSVKEMTEVLCGASRPGHFDGVASVVTKLFNIVQPDQAFFGQKDAQQVAVIQQMTNDLNMPVQIVPCPTLREPDGVAFSSRNVYLNVEERAQAVVLSHALSLAASLIRSGERDTKVLLREIEAKLHTAPLAVIDYASLLTYPSLETAAQLLESKQYIIALAVKLGRTRLIDNTIITV